MTIVASVKVRDGLILGTDSMTTIFGPQGILKTFTNARKLFRITGWPAGVMTYGLGNIGARSIEGLVLDFCRRSSPGPGKIEELARALYDFIKESYDQEFDAVSHGDRPELGFLVAGYSDGEPLPEEFEFLFPEDEAPSEVRPPDVFGASWRGQNTPFIRLYKGFDPRIAEALRGHGLDDGKIDAVTADLEASVLYDGMPVQDAINFATFILETTIAYTTFEVGPASCGRPLQVATILADEGFKWISKPELRVDRP
ncbi:MAG TPA: hypothetical protein VNB59_05555 [Solirubrobacterales bacterium]|jgi:hypothetical protein|nr:hypothetical protein [Solirubrobacterales bacterium]